MTTASSTRPDNFDAEALSHAPDILIDLVPGGKFQGNEYQTTNPNRADAGLGSYSFNLVTGAWADFALEGVRGYGLVSFLAYHLQVPREEAAGKVRAWLSDFDGVPRAKVEARPAMPAAPTPWKEAPPFNLSIGHFASPDRPKLQIAGIYYLDTAAGMRVGAEVRLEFEGGKLPLRASLRRDSAGRVVWAWNQPEKPFPLYGLGDLATSVLVVEGPKKVEAVRPLLPPGFSAVAWIGGAQAVRSSDWTALAGRSVVIWPDNDAPGKAVAETIAGIVGGGCQILNPDDIARACGLDCAPKAWDAADAVRDKMPATLLAKILGPQEAPAPGAAPEHDLTDLGNGRRFADQNRGSMHYCHDTSRWLWFDGVRWVEDRTGESDRRAKQTIESIYDEAKAETRDVRRAGLFKHAGRSQSRDKIRAAADMARSEPGIPILMDAFDSSPWLLNCPNGTVDLKTGQLRPHRREDYMTKLAGCPFDPAAKSERFQKYLDFVTGGDPALETFLRRAMGYSLTGSTAEEVLFFVYGPAASGKTTFLEAGRSCLGQYAQKVPFQALLKKKESSGASPEIARLVGVRLAFSSEVNKGERLAEGLVKEMTGGEKMAARNLFENTREFTPTHKLWLVANDRPQVSDDDTGLWRRILVLPFSRTVPAEKRDPALKEALQDPLRDAPAVLAWMVRGCLEWQREGLGVPPAVLTATDAYREDMDPLREFFSSELVKEEGGSAPVAEVRSRYEDWCKASGIRYPLTARDFNARLRAIGATDALIRRGEQNRPVKCWRGLKLALQPEIEM
jgi:P4 family phage/plasmid primase-like protien